MERRAAFRSAVPSISVQVRHFTRYLVSRFPTFVIPCSKRSDERRNRKDTSKRFDSSVALDLAFPQTDPPQDWWERQIRHTGPFQAIKSAPGRGGEQI